jgi:hypothetical protein
MLEKTKHDKNYAPIKNIKKSLLSRLFFNWVTPVIKLGNSTILEESMLEDLSLEERSSFEYAAFK